MFKFWKKKEEPKLDLARVEFIITESGEKPKLNIELMDYDDHSLQALCDIVEIFKDNRVLVEMLTFIQSHFLETERSEELIKIFVMLQQKSLLNVENEKEEPCIKPSDMMT